MRRSADVHRRGALRIVFGAVDVGPRRRVENEVRGVERGWRLRDVPVGARQRDQLDVGELFAQRTSELPAGARQDDAFASRSERVGDCVLQR